METFNHNYNSAADHFCFDAIPYNNGRIFFDAHTNTSGVGGNHLCHPHKASPVYKVSVDAYVLQKFQAGRDLDFACYLLCGFVACKDHRRRQGHGTSTGTPDDQPIKNVSLLKRKEKRSTP